MYIFSMINDIFIKTINVVFSLIDTIDNYLYPINNYTLIIDHNIPLNIECKFVEDNIYTIHLLHDFYNNEECLETYILDLKCNENIIKLECISNPKFDLHLIYDVEKYLLTITSNLEETIIINLKF